MGIVLLPPMLHGAGIFTYIWVILFGQMLVNIPAPWFAYGLLFSAPKGGPRKFVRLVTVRFSFSPHRTGVWSGFGGPAEPCEGEWLCRFAEGWCWN